MPQKLEIKYKPQFVRQYKKLEPELQSEVLARIELFKDIKNHDLLKVHKLKGRLKGRYSFSIDYKNRIVFIYEDKKTATLLVIGDHDVYK